MMPWKYVKSSIYNLKYGFIANRSEPTRQARNTKLNSTLHMLFLCFNVKPKNISFAILFLNKATSNLAMNIINFRFPHHIIVDNVLFHILNATKS
jgi:hypothetical protein